MESLQNTGIKEEVFQVNDKETTIKIELDSSHLEVQPHVEDVNVFGNTENIFENVQVAIKEELNIKPEENNILLDKPLTESLLVEKDSSETTIENDLNSNVKAERDDGECYNNMHFDDGSIDSNDATALGQVEACLQDYDDMNGLSIGVKNEEDLQNVVIKNESSVLPDTVVPTEITPDIHEHDQNPAPKYSFVTKIPGDMVDSIVNGTFDAESCETPNGEHHDDTEIEELDVNNSLFKISKETSQFQLNSITGDILSLEQEAYSAYALRNNDAVPCPKCPKICNKKNIKRHLSVHQSIDNYKNGRERGRLTRKLNQQNLIKKISAYHCHLCPKVHNDKSLLIKHIRKIHKNHNLQNIHDFVDNFNKVYEGAPTQEEGNETELPLNSYDSDELHTHQSELQEAYKCTCGKVFKRRSRMETCLRSHETSASDPNRFKCMTCSKQFQYKEALVLHRKRLHRKKIPCKFCPMGFNSRRKLLKHLQIHQKLHLKEYKVIEEVVKGKQVLKCFMCLKTCQALSELKTHVMTEHKQPYQCRHCNRTFPRIIDFGNHLEAYHPEVKGQSVLDVLKAFSRLIQEWKCKECHLQFLEPDKLALHEIEQHGLESIADAQFQCSDCRRVFVSQKGLTSHRRIHEEVAEKTNIDEMGVMCLECRMMCKDMQTLTSHMRFHSPDRKYVCKFCDFRFATLEKRRAHVEIHTGDMKFVCFICEYQCTSLNRLKKHKESLKHANMKEYLLTGKPLIAESTPNAKEKKGSAKKRKKGKESNKSEKDNDTVSECFDTEESEVSCDICGEKFSDESAMLEHKQTHPFIEFPNDDKPSRIFFK